MTELIYAWRRRTLVAVGEAGLCRSERSVFLKEGKKYKKNETNYQTVQIYDRAVNGREKD